MADDRPRGTCVIPGCPRDPYPDEAGHRRLVCGPHVSQAEHMLREMPQLVKDLEDKDAPEEVTVRAEVRERLVGWTAGPDWHPPLALAAVVQVEQLVVAGALPAAAVGGAARGGPVSGSPARRLPINVDAVDLLGPARSLRRAASEDDIGFLSVASTLDFWVQDLRDHRGRGEGLPEPSVSVLATWLAERIDEACDDWLPVDEFFDDVNRAYGALRAQLGLIDIPDYKRGIPCSKCGHLTLLRHGGRDYVECASCPYALTIPEYERYVSTLSTMLGTAEREKRRKATEDRRATVRLLRGLLAAGWRHTINFVPSERDPDGAPYHEGYLEHVWTRPGERLWAWWRIDPRQPIWSISLGAVEGDDEVDARLDVSVSWVEANGVKRLHHLAAAAGVLALPKEADGGR